MQRDHFVHEYGPRALSTTVTAMLMPSHEVSKRTETTRRIGAQQIVRHLAAGEWGKLSDSDRAIIGGCLGRMIANAERQGVDVIYPVSEVVDSPE